MFFRIFELILIAAFLYLIYRLLIADFREAKKKVDAILEEENNENIKPKKEGINGTN